MYKEIFANKKVALFDLDGTVIQSNYLWDEAIRAISIEVGAGIPNKYPTGLPLNEKWTRLIKDNEVDKTYSAKDLSKRTCDKFLELAGENLPEVTDGFWGFTRELRDDKGYKIGLTTNTPRETTLPLLELLEIETTFDYIVCGDDVKKPKPHSDMYKKALKDMKVDKKSVIVFEDSIVGATASTDAGLNTIIIWDASIPKKRYPNSVLGFVPSFWVFPGNLDLTRKEFYQKWIEVEIEAAKQAKNTIPQQTEK